MSDRGKLRGMAWDHPRARGPLEAIAADWSKRRGIPVEWDARPLKDFEDQPLAELASAYDLVLMDYPFAGTAATSGLIVPVNDWVDESYLADQAAHSVGPSYASYTWGGKQWALAIDAACQVSAVREDLWHGAGLARLPETWADVAELATERRNAPGKVGMPLNPNHAYCAFLSSGVSLAGGQFWPVGGHIDPQAGVEALDFLRKISRDLHPASRTDDPIAMSDRMSATDEIVYVPLMFGYSNYARPGFRARVLRFGNAPRGVGGKIGSVLGGVGLALSSCSTRRDDAAELATRIASPEVQSGTYADSGGQPGHGAAWEAPRVNRQTGDFFTSTRQTIDCAFVRPRVPGHRRFQQRAGELIYRFLWSGGTTASQCLAGFSYLIETLLLDPACDARR